MFLPRGCEPLGILNLLEMSSPSPIAWGIIKCRVNIYCTFEQKKKRSRLIPFLPLLSVILGKFPYVSGFNILTYKVRW